MSVPQAWKGEFPEVSEFVVLDALEPKLWLKIKRTLVIGSA